MLSLCCSLIPARSHFLPLCSLSVCLRVNISPSIFTFPSFSGGLRQTWGRRSPSRGGHCDTHGTLFLGGEGGQVNNNMIPFCSCHNSQPQPMWGGRGAFSPLACCSLIAFNQTFDIDFLKAALQKCPMLVTDSRFRVVCACAAAARQFFRLFKWWKRRRRHEDKVLKCE